MSKVRIGFAPTRRNIFSAPDAVKYAELTRVKLDQLEIDFVDIAEFNEDGLLYDEADLEPIIEKFKAANIQGLFLPHTNFGTEYVCARLAKALGVPVLLWGPRDERPDEDGIRLRDTQCGLFATGKVLRRFQVPFTYMTNCRLDDPEFERGITDFLAVCRVVSAFNSIKILQIGPRPYDFLTTMCNEGELLEKFNVQLAPVPIPELIAEIHQVKKVALSEIDVTVMHCQKCTHVQMQQQDLEMVAALKVAMQNLCRKYGCNAIAIQCWTALQDEIGIMPCAANAMLIDEGIPVVCETDIHGAITSILIEAASREGKKSIFADWTVRHPDNENGELLQHCGLFPFSAAREKPTLGYPLAFSHPGAVAAEAKHGELTLCRFDGDNGEYSLLLGNAKAIEGPYTKGTYLWVEVANLKRLEEKIVSGPYIHHVSGIHEDVVPILYEACKYIGVTVDLYDPIEEEVRAYLRGE
ncbi:L-fucose/L-arabinose isomerase family protein [Culicoidibacter larvae]|uniref:Fucose isomerase n=1 Tax=Culicoidibacter larvae TaxID=2579976 RepID=A0A5R8QC64_9FIRM|nr:L-fucose/L-arabinose isomerase family protein [Culicoidibacter larvae]TLG73934.1 fucose isomerase [Culicoidibacter larvae]